MERINTWKAETAFVTVKNDSKYDNNRNKRNNNNRKPSHKEDKDLIIKLSSRASLSTKEITDEKSGLTIVVGKHVSKETKEIRDLIKERAQDNFHSKKEKEIERLSALEKAAMQIHYELNKVSAANMDYIFKVLKPYITGQNRVIENSSLPISLGLIKLIIEKC